MSAGETAMPQNLAALHGGEELREALREIAADNADMPGAFSTPVDRGAAIELAVTTGLALFASAGMADARDPEVDLTEAHALANLEDAVDQRLRTAAQAMLLAFAEGVVWNEEQRGAYTALHAVLEAEAERQHADDAAVDGFAATMKAKLAVARANGRSGWDDPAQCSSSDLNRLLHEHVAKGDPVDVANFCMMLAHYGASTAAPIGDVAAEARREQGLTITIVDGQLLISIGIDALMTAVRGGDDWDDDAVIVDPDVFAAEIAYALEHNEQEDGTTDLHLAIDRAALTSVEGGSEAVRWPGEDA